MLPALASPRPVQCHARACAARRVDSLPARHHRRSPLRRQRERRRVVDAVAAVEAGDDALALQVEGREGKRHVIEPRRAPAAPEEDEELDAGDGLLGVEDVRDLLPPMRSLLEVPPLPPQVGAVVIPAVHVEAVVRAARAFGLAPPRDHERVSHGRVEGDRLHRAPGLIIRLRLAADRRLASPPRHELIPIACRAPSSRRLLLEARVDEQVLTALGSGDGGGTEDAH